MKSYKLELNKLTPKQYEYFKTHIYNGVGSDHFFINPHDLIFKLAAEAHDFAYWRGGTDEDRVISDKIYLRDSLSAIRLQPRWKRIFYYPIAYIYYFFLTIFGRFAFEYRNAPIETWRELKKAFRKEKGFKGRIRQSFKRMISKARPE